MNGKIIKSVTSIYGEKGHATITMNLTTIESIKSDKDMKLDSEISYFIDFKGNLIGEKITDRIDIFKEFKDAVQFELK